MAGPFSYLFPTFGRYTPNNYSERAREGMEEVFGGNMDSWGDMSVDEMLQESDFARSFPEDGYDWDE